MSHVSTEPQPTASTSAVKQDESPPQSNKFQLKSKKARGKSYRDILLSGLAGGIGGLSVLLCSSGFVAGCVAKTGVAPLDRIKILFQTGEPEYRRFSGSVKGAWLAGRQIWSETGMRGLLQGHTATLARIFPYAGIKFMAYEAYHRVLMPTYKDETSLRLLAAGSLAGLTSVCITYPLDLLRVRLAFEIKHSPQDRVSFFKTAKRIYTEGAPAENTSGTTRAVLHRFPILKFYRGYFVSLLGMVPYAGTSFLVWGQLQSKVRTAPISDHQRRRWRTPIDLTIGALAGAISQTASYPFEVVRRRMQVGGLVDPHQLVSLPDTVRRVYRSGGWRAFFIGLSLGYVKVVPMTALAFTTWKASKRLFGMP